MGPGTLLVVYLFWEKTLRGVGQIIFQGNALSGLLFLAGIALASPLMAAGALLGAVLGTLTAVVLKYDPGEIEEGIFGFNAALLGLAFLFVHPFGFMSALFMVAGSVLATMMTQFLRQKSPFPTYTTPFILTAWLVYGLGAWADLPLLEHPPAPNVFRFFQAVMESLSEVMFQANIGTGILFLAAIAVSHFRHAEVALAGALVGTLVARYHNDPAGAISLGIYGYNASLAAIALHLWRPSWTLPLLGAIVTVPITEIFPHLGLATLTAPFVLASWLVIGLDKMGEQKGIGGLE